MASLDNVLTLERSQKRFARLVALPGMVVLVLLVVGPLAYMLFNSFFAKTLATPVPPRFAWFENYGNLFTDGRFWNAFLNSMIIMVIGIPVQSFLALVLALGFSYWTSYARLARGIVLSIKEKEYVLSATVCGASSARILLRHVLPNAINPVMILASLHLGQMIIAEASLSYLGLGIQPPDISWGGMIADGRNYLGSAWWAATFPGVAIAATVLVMGMFGDAVRDALDPKFRFH